MDFWLELFAYFILYSFLGWVLESVCKTYWEKRFVNSGFLHGPFCPIYGVGALIMWLVLSYFKSNIFLLFFSSFFVLTIWEYLVGILLEKMFHTKYWDYSKNRWNFQGRICLQNSLFWGILGTLFILVLHPMVEVQIAKIPQNLLLYLDAVLLLCLLVDTIATIIKVKNIEVNLHTIKVLGENLKEKVEELKNIREEYSKTTYQDKIQERIEELKYKQARLIRKLYKQTLRLKKAFPTMQSEKISEFLNQKIDFSNFKPLKKNKQPKK